ncbi:TatD family hydrolase [Spiribacter halobius]|uniref:TatD family hydrolase n=1 Tax=Sediminicurvatus halobius TaxID=2182432 RepID=UPI001E625115|nr:TatD family hydrolase [Spiribacter halobius]UEX76735.1 TatD family hydrolase [Spiribacter halobius]
MPASELIDIGVNLTHKRFHRDRDAVIQRAADAGVTRMVLTGVDAPGSQAALELAQLHPGRMTATAGVHPHHAADWDGDTEAALRRLLAAPQAVAVGETGLDFFRDFSPRPAQEAAFEAQLDLAAETGRPVFLHQRDAAERFLAILRAHRQRLCGAVLHCFTGDQTLLHACLDLDLHIGVTGWVCDERRGGALRECVADIPADRLMIETDAPFLLPRDLEPRPRDGRNEPAFLPHILRAVAALRDETPAALAETTRTTAERFFGLAG